MKNKILIGGVGVVLILYLMRGRIKFSGTNSKKPKPINSGLGDAKPYYPEVASVMSELDKVLQNCGTQFTKGDYVYSYSNLAKKFYKQTKTLRTKPVSDADNSKPIPSSQTPQGTGGIKPMPSSQTYVWGIPVPAGTGGIKPMPNSPTPQGTGGIKPMPSSPTPQGTGGVKPMPSSPTPQGTGGIKPMPSSQTPDVRGYAKPISRSQSSRDVRGYQKPKPSPLDGLRLSHGGFRNRGASLYSRVSGGRTIDEQLGFSNIAGESYDYGKKIEISIDKYSTACSTV